MFADAKRDNSTFLRNSVLLITLSQYVTLRKAITLSQYVTLRKAIPCLRDSVAYLIISALRYLVIPFTVSTWSGAVLGQF